MEYTSASNIRKQAMETTNSTPVEGTNSTPVEGTNSYLFVVDITGLSIPKEIEVNVETENVLRINFKHHDGLQGWIWENRRFFLPANSNTDKISAVYLNSELIVSVKKASRPMQTSKIIQVAVV